VQGVSSDSRPHGGVALIHPDTAAWFDRLVARERLDVRNIAAGLQEAREERRAELVRVRAFDLGVLGHALDDLVDVVFLAGDGGKNPAGSLRQFLQSVGELI
jgi:hypothetical protein